MSKQKSGLASLLLLASLAWGLSGCGGQSQDAAPPIAAAEAAVEISAPTEAATIAAPTATPTMKPTQKATARPTVAPTPTATETPQNTPTVEVIDELEVEYWGSLPAPTDVFDFHFDGGNGPEGALSATSFSDLVSLVALYRRELFDQGWQEQTEAAVIEEDKATLLFEDHEVILRLELSQVEEEVTEINLTSAVAEGSATTVDVKELPRPEDITGLQTQGTEFLRYDIESDLESMLEFYRRELTALGWQEQTEFGYIEDHAVLRFFGKGNFQVSVLLLKLGAKEIGVDLEVRDLAAEAAVAEAAETARAAIPPLVAGEPAVIANYEVPLPDTAIDVKIETTTLSYMVTSDPMIVFDFYHPALTSLGWRQIEAGGSQEGSVSQSTYRFTNDADASLNLVLSHEVTFDSIDSPSEINVLIEVTGAASATTTEPEELTAVDQDGLPVPDDFYNYFLVDGGKYRKSVQLTSRSDLATVLDFYRRELTAQGWQEQTDAAVVEETSASLKFERQEDTLVLELSQTSAGETDIAMSAKLTSAAEAAGVLPQAGRSQIILGNFSEAEVVVIINQQEIKLAPGAGVVKPEKELTLDLDPGRYPFTIKIPDQAAIEDEIEVGPDETWGLIVGPGGALPVPVY